MAQVLSTRQPRVKAEKKAKLNGAPAGRTSRRLWTRDEYYRMGELGILDPEEKTELIEGEIYRKMSPMRVPHRRAIHRVVVALTKLFEPGSYVESQMPATLSDTNEPQPDVYVARGGFDDYVDRHPGAADLILAVEVADSSLRLDRTRKATLYAKYAIPEYWIVNLIDRKLEVHREPKGGKYHVITVLGDAESVSPLAAPQAKIAVSDLMP